MVNKVNCQYENLYLSLRKPSRRYGISKFNTMLGSLLCSVATPDFARVFFFVCFFFYDTEFPDNKQNISFVNFAVLFFRLKNGSKEG